MFSFNPQIHYFTSNKDPNMARNLTYTLALCNSDPINEKAIREFINYFFSLRFSHNNTYASIFIDAIFRLCNNKKVHEYVIQKIYETMLVTRQHFSCIFYKSAAHSIPYVIMFIDGHAKELDDSFNNNTHLLSYNWAAAPGLLSYPVNDADNRYLLETFQNALRAHPATFTEFIESIETIKSRAEITDTLYLNYSNALRPLYNNNEYNEDLDRLVENIKNMHSA